MYPRRGRDGWGRTFPSKPMWVRGHMDLTMDRLASLLGVAGEGVKEGYFGFEFFKLGGQMDGGRERRIGTIGTHATSCIDTL